MLVLEKQNLSTEVWVEVWGQVLSFAFSMLASNKQDLTFLSLMTLLSLLSEIRIRESGIPTVDPFVNGAN